MAFDRAAFDAEFKKAIKKLAAAEKVTKEQLKDLSRSVLEAVHSIAQIHYVNDVLKVLTPMNKQMAFLYFKEFTGYRYNDEAFEFTNKNKGAYDKAHAAAMELLADPHQNIWTWAERKGLKVEAKPFDLEKISDYIKNSLKKAKKEGFNTKDVLRAVLKGGIEAESILDLMDELGYAEVKEE